MTDWRATLKQNWLYMLTAILVSLFLWVGVSADRVAQRDIPAELTVINNDRRYVIVEREPAAEVVTVTFTGRAGDLGFLEASRPQIFVPIDSVESLTTEVALTPDMVRTRGGRDLDVRAMGVRPDRIQMRFEPRAQKVVRVVPRLTIDPATGYVQTDSPTVQPGAVAVSGPESALRGIDSVMTAPIVKDDVRAPIDTAIPLERPLNGGRVELSSPSVRVRVPIDAWVERTFAQVPVVVSGVEENAVIVEPSLVTIRLAGPESVVEAVEIEQLTPRVELDTLSETERLHPVVLAAPDRRLQVDVRPDSVRVRRSGGV